MTVKVEINANNRIEITSEYRDKQDCKSIPGARWNRDSRLWTVPLAWSSCKVLRSVFGTRLEIGPELLKWAQCELERRVQPSLTLRTMLEPADPTTIGQDSLYPFQRVGAQFLVTAKQAILGDPVGSGKTIQVIAAAKSENALPMLVVCPNSVKQNWAREVGKWWPGTPVYVVDGSAAKRAKILAAAAQDPSAIVVVNWESVRLHSRLAPYGSIALTESEKEPKELNQIPFKTVVADEAHRMKDPTSKQTRAVWAVAHQASVEFRWALTGTPLTKTPDTLWPILHFLNKAEWAGKTAFIDRWCLYSFNPWGGLEVGGIRPEMAEEFFSIFDPRFRRMPKEVVLPNLPPVIREQRMLPMGQKQAKAYNQMVESMCAQDDNGEMIVASNPISRLTRLIQFSSACAEVSVLPEGENHVILMDPSNKLDALMTDLPDWLDAGEPVVVFAQSRQLIRLAASRLEKAHISFSIIEGGQTSDTRQREIDRYMNGDTNVCLVVIAAGGGRDQPEPWPYRGLSSAPLVQR